MTAACPMSSWTSPASNAEGVVCTYPWNPERQDEKLEAFRTAFRERFGDEPETYAAHAYDGMNMFIWAIQTAGLNRAKIRDVIAYRSEPFPGVTGDIPLSAALDDDGRCLSGPPRERPMEVLLARRTRHSQIVRAILTLGTVLALLGLSRASPHNNRRRSDPRRIFDCADGDAGVRRAGGPPR